MLLDGKGGREVARLLTVSESAVSRWREAVESGGNGLASKPHPGPAPWLSAAQQERLKELLIAGAIASGFPWDSWTCSPGAQLIEEQFAVAHNPDHVWKWLRGLGFACQQTKQHVRERDEDVIATWRRKEWRRIKERQAGNKL